MHMADHVILPVCQLLCTKRLGLHKCQVYTQGAWLKGKPMENSISRSYSWRAAALHVWRDAAHGMGARSNSANTRLKEASLTPPILTNFDRRCRLVDRAIPSWAPNLEQETNYEDPQAASTAKAQANRSLLLDLVIFGASE